MVRLPDKASDDKDHGEVPSLTALSQEVKELVRLISATDVSELHLENGQVSITIKRGAQPLGSHPTPTHAPPAALSQPEPSSIVNLIGNSPMHGAGIPLNEGEQLLVAPMVGTFYNAPAPNEPPFVSEGDAVEAGQTVGIIEAMKMMNEIESELAGKVVSVLVQNAQAVEYGQPLMVIETHET